MLFYCLPAISWLARTLVAHAVVITSGIIIPATHLSQVIEVCHISLLQSCLLCKVFFSFSSGLHILILLLPAPVLSHILCTSRALLRLLHMIIIIFHSFFM